MNGKNFSPGDVVVCVEVDFDTPELTLRALYTVAESFWHAEDGPGVDLEGITPVEGPDVCFDSSLFRLAYKPDPEVGRERAERPIKRPVQA